MGQGRKKTEVTNKKVVSLIKKNGLLFKKTRSPTYHFCPKLGSIFDQFLGTLLYTLKLVSTRFGVMGTPIDVYED